MYLYIVKMLSIFGHINNALKYIIKVNLSNIFNIS